MSGLVIISGLDPIKDQLVLALLAVKPWPYTMPASKGTRMYGLKRIDVSSQGLMSPNTSASYLLNALYTRLNATGIRLLRQQPPQLNPKEWLGFYIADDALSSLVFQGCVVPKERITGRPILIPYVRVPDRFTILFKSSTL
jgi:hypothetical protein